MLSKKIPSLLLVNLYYKKNFPECYDYMKNFSIKICGNLFTLILPKYIQNFFFFWLNLWHVEVPRLDIKPKPQQRAKSLQRPCWILNLLCHKGTLMYDSM